MHTKRLMCLAAAVLMMVAILMVQRTDALSVKIEPLSEQCFWEDVKKVNVSHLKIILVVENLLLLFVPDDVFELLIYLIMAMIV